MRGRLLPHAQARPFRESECAPTRQHFLPHFPDAKVARPHRHVVHEENAARRQLREPRFHIMPHRFFRVQAIDVQKVDARGRELGQRLVEVAPEQGGERRVMRPVMRRHFGKRRLIVRTRLVIALPGIDRETLRPRAVLGRGLTETEVALAPIRPQLYEQTGTQSSHQVVSEEDVIGPGPEAVAARRKMCGRQRHGSGFSE